MHRFVFIVCALWLAVVPQARAQLSLTGVGGGHSAGGGGSTPQYFHGAFTSKVLLTTSSALNNITNGPKGIISFWINTTADNNGQPSPGSSDLMSNNSGSNYTSEHVSGANIVIDSPFSPGNFRIHLNLNEAGYNGSSGWPETDIGDFDDFVGATMNGKWNHFLFLWDNSTSTDCTALYVNGALAQSNEMGQRNGPNPSYNYANSSGFSVGGVAWTLNHYSPVGLAEVYVNFNPTSSPCSGGAAPAGLLNHFWQPTVASICSDTTFGTPAVCFSGDTNTPTTFNTNQGNGGAFTYGGTPGCCSFGYGPSAGGAAPPSSLGPYLKWSYSVGNSGTPDFGTGNSLVPAPGDLIVALVGQASNSASFAPTHSVTAPSGYQNLFYLGGANVAGHTGNSGYTAVSGWWKIAGAGEKAPTVSTSDGSAVLTSTILIFGNVNSSQPAHAFTSGYSNGTSSGVTCNGYAGKAGDTEVFLSFPWSYNDTGGGLASQNLDAAGTIKWKDGPSLGWLGVNKPTVGIYTAANATGVTVQNTATTGGNSDAYGCVLFELAHP